jgi:hypothetical protein
MHYGPPTIRGLRLALYNDDQAITISNNENCGVDFRTAEIRFSPLDFLDDDDEIRAEQTVTSIFETRRLDCLW